MQFLTPTTLTGHLVSLEPLDDVHIEGLRAAVQDGHINDLWYTSAPAPETVAADVKAKRDLAERGLMLPFALRRLADGQLVGVTTYCHPLPTVPAVEIGYTWQAASAHRTGTNTEAKLLMLAHAFEQWGCRGCVSGRPGSTIRRGGRSSGWGRCSRDASATTGSCAPVK